MILILTQILLLLNFNIHSDGIGEKIEKQNATENNNETIKVVVKIQINKIYGINTADKTYIVDGYLVASWKDVSKKDTLVSREDLIYENDFADEKIGRDIWIPAFEFVNVVGNREIGNKQIIISESGQVTYNERFNAVFTAPMDFKTFPFDTQNFLIQLEAFSYDEEKLVFLKGPNQHDFFSEGMADEWDIQEKKTYISSKDYSHLSENGEAVFFSRYNQEITAKRKIRYYLWQMIIPLFLIIAISWSVFWIPSLSDQLATNFTLMLTVVAFNFNTSSMLPNLPYSTFIESLVTLGYLSIFVSLIIVIKGSYLKKTRKDFDYKRLMNYCKYIFPISFLLLVLIQLLIFFTP